MNGNLELTAEPGHCQCGCGSLVNGGKAFLQGHDAKLKSQLIALILEDGSVITTDDGVRTETDGQSFANRYGFGHQVAATVASRVVKHAAKVERDSAKAAAHVVRTPQAVKDTAGMVGDFGVDGTPCRAKVGRWEYDGRISPDSSTFVFTTPKGEVKTSTRFTLV